MNRYLNPLTYVNAFKNRVMLFKFIELLRIKKIRFLVVKYRYLFLKNNMKFKSDGSASIGDKTVKYNLTSFDNLSAAFGCGERMGLLIYPVIAHTTFFTIDRSKLKVLIVGCRTEDDIFWMKSYGFEQTFGLDLFTYSKHILLGDIHKSEFANEHFDVVLLGWMISYSKDPLTVVKECRRILKPGGLLGIGLDHNPNFDPDNISPLQVNNLNSAAQLVELMDSAIKHKVLFKYEHYNQKMGDNGVAVISVVE